MKLRGRKEGKMNDRIKIIKRKKNIDVERVRYKERKKERFKKV